MNSKKPLFWNCMVVVTAFLLVFTTCEGPIGHEGIQGEQGEQGDKGDKGEKGDLTEIVLVAGFDSALKNVYYVEAGNKLYLRLDVNPIDATIQSIVWTSSNPAVVGITSVLRVETRSIIAVTGPQTEIEAKTIKSGTSIISATALGSGGIEVTMAVTINVIADLPVIKIDTVNAAPILDRENWVNMTFSLTDQKNPENNISAIGNQQIRGRGNSTWLAPKKPYRIRFRDNQQQTPFGLPAARNWVLLANYYDSSFMGTAFAFELGKRLGLEYTCTYHYVDFFLNGEYQGVYIFTEHRQADPAEIGAPGRPKIDLEEGWLVEIDIRFDTTSATGDAGFRTTNYDLPVLIKSPDFPIGVIPDLDDNFVRNDWNELTDLLFSDDFPENGYRDLIDMDTFIKYFMVQIITNNSDFNVNTYDTRNHPGSIFLYKDKDEKIKAGPLWDFDLTFGFRSVLTADSLPYPNYPFFSRFFDDPVFLLRWKEIWNESYDVILSMREFINDTEDKIRSSVEFDIMIWQPNLNFNTRVNALKDYFDIRIPYLNNIYNIIP